MGRSLIRLGQFGWYCDSCLSAYLIHCRTLLLAGHDTSANSLTWFFWELAKHLESQQEIREEIAAVRARIGARDFSITDLEGMSTMLAGLKVRSVWTRPVIVSLTAPAGVHAAAPYRMGAFKSCCSR